MSQRHNHTPDFRHGCVVGLTNQKVFAPRHVAENVDTNASERLGNRLLPNEGADLMRANMKILSKAQRNIGVLMLLLQWGIAFVVL
jgi:hypothetical protein